MTGFQNTDNMKTKSKPTTKKKISVKMNASQKPREQKSSDLKTVEEIHAALNAGNHVFYLRDSWLFPRKICGVKYARVSRKILVECYCQSKARTFWYFCIPPDRCFVEEEYSKNP